MGAALPAHVEAELARVVDEINASGLVPAGYRVELCRDPVVPEPIRPPDRLISQGGWCAPGFDVMALYGAAQAIRSRPRTVAVVATSYTLTINVPAANAIGLNYARVLVTDTTRRTFNRAIVLTPVRTGLLRAQNKSRVYTRGSAAIGEIWNDTEYAAAVHDGTRAHDIRPRRAKALRFKVGGRTVFAAKVHKKATRGRPWLTRALRDVAAPAGYRIVVT